MVEKFGRCFNGLSRYKVSKQASRQTGRQASRQAGRQASKQASREIMRKYRGGPKVWQMLQLLVALQGTQAKKAD